MAFPKIKSFFFENTSDRQTLAKNTIWLSISNFGGRLIKAIVIIYGARVLGVEGWGVFSYAVTLAATITLIMDPGVNSILLRDASKAPEEERRAIFSTALVIKLALLAIGVCVITYVAPLFSTLPGARALLPMVAFVLAFDTLREFFSSLMRAMERMELEALVFLITNASIVVFGLVALAMAPTPASFAWGYVLGTGVGAIAAGIVLRANLKNVFSSFKMELVPGILMSAWPFAITGALGLLLTHTDILIISWMRTASDVGVYSAIIRIVQILYLVPTIIQLTALPLFSRLAGKDDRRFRVLLEKTLGIIFLASIPMAVGGILLGKEIMGLVFGAPFTPGGTALKVLMATMIIDYPATVISAAIFAYGHQRSLIITSTIAGTLNVALDLLLIPRFGIVGSGVATLIAQFAGNWYLWHTMRKINRFSVIPKLPRIAGASLVMGILVFIMNRAGLSAAFTIVAAAAVYAGILIFLKEPLIADLRAILRSKGAEIGA